MDLHLVTYFVAVVDHGGITRAAQSLYISQPSLSQAIRTLERRLGVTLFDRTGRRLELTEDGRTLDVAARRILADVERAKAKVAAVRELVSGRVDVVTYAAFSIDPIVDLVRRFREQYPRVTVRIIDEDGPTGVLGALRRGEAELGVIDLSVDHSALRSVPIGDQELVLALPDALAATLPDPVPRSAVRDIPLVQDLGDKSDAALITELVGEPANVVIDCTHPGATWELVMRGAGATVLPRLVAEEQLRGVSIRSMTPKLTRPVGLVQRSGPGSPAASAFVAIAQATRTPAPE
ncbi:LysR family transcriptional regulator [Rhodococcus jostii]|uniref:LysR family transcriptional regulator n=1 Tax=Rhodococcus jostii TaxID=132919 RepID=A0ABU4CC59_RHOJO|nr:LysR family transcriptional regulator [Rhodococcus jostii]MDV6281130.1 LysR family transcriptional regulator [Rhodococcus jostii]